MKKIRSVSGAGAAIAVLLLVLASCQAQGGQTAGTEAKTPVAAQAVPVPAYEFPKTYQGIYLNVTSGKDAARLGNFIDRATKAGINTFVIDVQPSSTGACAIPKENVDLILARGIHPIARVVCWEGGLTKFPVAESEIQEKLNFAKTAAEAGFKEIQFDYVRFADSAALAKMPLADKYTFIEGFLARAKTELKPYGVKVAADVFGRIPLNTGDTIGQRMEGLDAVIDVICPMAYPSHYTWSEKMMSDPYYTVFTTATKARDRVKNADIVAYIQAFQIKVAKSGLSYAEYVKQQIKAVHDAKIRGYLLWNAAQDYEVPFQVTEEYYRSPAE